MASHGQWDRHFFTIDGMVMEEGRSFNLSKGVFGIVDKGAEPTSKGLKVTSVFPKTPKNRLFELSMGTADLAVSRS